MQSTITMSLRKKFNIVSPSRPGCFKRAVTFVVKFYEMFHVSILSPMYGAPLSYSLQICRVAIIEKKLVHTYSTEFIASYEGWNFNSGNYLFTTDTK